LFDIIDVLLYKFVWQQYFGVDKVVDHLGNTATVPSRLIAGIGNIPPPVRSCSCFPKGHQVKGIVGAQLTGKDKWVVIHTELNIAEIVSGVVLAKRFYL